MRCAHCGNEIPTEEQECPSCRQQRRDEVKVLSREEREGFQGVTLENTPDGEPRESAEQRGGPRPRIYVRQVTFGSGKMSFWTKLLIAAVFAVVVFVFLPLMLFFIVGVSLLWMVFRLLSR